MWFKFIATLYVSFIGLSSSAFAASPAQAESAGILQLVESRDGRRSCWGLVIQLSRTKFRKNITLDQISVRESKRGSELKSLMTWSVDQSKKKLVIKFKPGSGNFGSGNSVQVQIDRSALVRPILSPNNRFEWCINTNVM